MSKAVVPSSQPFVVRWRALLTDARLDPTAVAVGFILAQHCDFETGANARPSYSTISICLGGISPETIRKATHRLREAGLIAQSSRPSPGKATVWRLTDPSWVEAEEASPHATPQATPHVGVDPPVHQITSDKPSARAEGSRVSENDPDPLGFLAYDRDLAVVEQHLGGFRSMGERITAEEMLLLPERNSVARVVNTVEKHHRGQRSAWLRIVRDVS